ncbi:hypothetical protein BJ875DRAFT_483215 [Amylocarpus encephaloides]|uniref:Rhodopsin domain-containing protein n=1 Tax=Amylocarpus encephaloides TaxID=45428 RepID=A0A9P7YM11_9HELO|nr:hypothetical protein BJ875DRAFT_483215 [Amylocarpus encephaloides]
MSLLDLLPYDTPALPPPPGIKSNFDDAYNRGYVMVIVGTVMLVFTAIFSATRLYVQLFLLKKRNWGDFFFILALLGALGLFIDICIEVKITPVGKHQWDVRISDALAGPFLITGSLITVLILSLSHLAAKLTLFVMYFEFFRPFRWMRICVWVGIAITTTFYVISAIGFVYLCIPKHGNTWQTQALTHDSDLEQQYYVPHRAVGVVIDLYLLVLPMKAVMDLQLPRKKKLRVIACIAFALSVYYSTVQVSSKDVTWVTVDTLITALVELDVGVIIACMPSMSKFLHSRIPALKTPFSFRSAYFRSHFRLRGREGNNSRFKSSERSDNDKHFSSAEQDGGLEMGRPVSLDHLRIMEDGTFVPLQLNNIKCISTNIRSDNSGS